MTFPQNFGGVVPPICTPFTDSGEIDGPSLENLLRYQIDGGVTGIFALGTTSETGALTDAQRTQVLEITVGTVAGQVPVIAGALASATGAVIGYAQQAEALGVDGIVALGPYYHKFNDVEIANHFRAVKAAIGIPLIAYNIPQMTQTDLASAVVVQLARGLPAGPPASFPGGTPAAETPTPGSTDKRRYNKPRHDERGDAWRFHWSFSVRAHRVAFP